MSLKIHANHSPELIKAQKHFFWMYCRTSIYQYLFSCSAHRMDGAGKAHNHLEMSYALVAIIEQIDKDDANIHGSDDTPYDKLVYGSPREIDKPFLRGSFMYQFVHDHSQELTDNLDTIGLTRDNMRPDYDTMAPIFADKFFDLAYEAIGFWKEAALKREAAKQ